MESQESLTRECWQARREAHRARLGPWAEARVRRSARHEKHPVHDFLFEYYSVRPAHLLRWSPGFDVRLEGASRAEVDWAEFAACEGGLAIPASAFPAHRLAYLDWAVSYLEAVAGREPAFACLGLHEWAMVYRDPNVRHPYVPLRLSRAAIDAFVESQPLRCTHYDAFRFFTAAAVPRNRLMLSRDTTAEHDQAGCVHVTMDLYKFAFKIAPFGPSELLADAFELAASARAVDMRASPYDLSSYGYAPIAIETRPGREEYVAAQCALRERAGPIRAALRDRYRHLAKCAAPAPPSRLSLPAELG